MAISQVISLLVLSFISITLIFFSLYLLGVEYFSALILLSVPIICKKRWYKWIYILYKTLPRDFIGMVRYVKVMITLKRWLKADKSITEIFRDNFNKYPDRICFHFEDKAYTFQDIEHLSNKVARYFKRLGLRKGDTVSLLLENRPEYVCIWLGLAKIGVSTALLNTSLRNKALLHCINIVNSKGIIYGNDFRTNIEEVYNQFDKDFPLYQYNTSVEPRELLLGSKNLEQALNLQSKESLRNDEWVKTDFSDNLYYIYTSGTTGLPKVCKISHARFALVSTMTHHICDVSKNDIFYTTMPLYHISGGIVAVGQAFLFTTCVVVRRKFSAQNFFKDCIKYKCTVAQYIGEICRYLLATPVNVVTERGHSIRMMIGNGMKAQFWIPFQKRFGVRNLAEYYGSTEGNVSVGNFEGIPGAVGFKPRYVGNLLPINIISVDEVTGEPVRDKKGLCMNCRPNEAGILIGKIRKNVFNRFAGYTDNEATKKKILENVFQKGDSYFNTGDLVVMDELGYIYFKDRTGDTFRWKGENVSTTEVEGYIANIIQLKDTAVYGVEVPDMEGRCGMVAIVDPNDQIDLKNLAKGIRRDLPPYAFPYFLRILKQLDITSTFKIKKTQLQNEGFNINQVKDQLYFYDLKLGEYVPLTTELYKNIMERKIRF